MKEKWEIVEHSWSDTSIYNQDGRLICTKSIDDGDTTEENQDEREEEVSRDFNLIVLASQMKYCLDKLYNQGKFHSEDFKTVADLLGLENNKGITINDLYKGNK